MSLPVDRMSAALVGAVDAEIVNLESVEVGGALVSGVYRYTRVWAREADGQWRVAGGHVSALPSRPPGARTTAGEQ